MQNALLKMQKHRIATWFVTKHMCLCTSILKKISLFWKKTISYATSGQTNLWKMMVHRSSRHELFIKKLTLTVFLQYKINCFMKTHFFIWSRLRCVVTGFVHLHICMYVWAMSIFHFWLWGPLSWPPCLARTCLPLSTRVYTRVCTLGYIP